jgi:hypothetical protein
MKTISIFLLLLASCNVANIESSGANKTVKEMSPTEVNNYYTGIRNRLNASRLQLAADLNNAKTLAEKKDVYMNARKLLVRTMIDSMFTCWYGTDWDFNGTTTKPQSGNIACGYFVTTLIQQAGFEIPRTKLAQCASSSMIDVLCPKKSITIITQNNVAKVKEHLLAQPDGLFILGLDTHTGFIVKSGNKLEFVHSNYSFRNDDVTHEDFDKCSTIQNNNYFVIGNFSQSDTTIKNWLQGKTYVMN